MKGRKFFYQITENELKAIPQEKKGRNLERHKRRNEQLFYRYYYYARLKRLTYVDVLNAISNDFFISPATIIEIIVKDTGRIQEINQQALKPNSLAKLFPHMNWKQ